MAEQILINEKENKENPLEQFAFYSNKVIIYSTTTCYIV